MRSSSHLPHTPPYRSLPPLIFTPFWRNARTSAPPSEARLPPLVALLCLLAMSAGSWCVIIYGFQLLHRWL